MDKRKTKRFIIGNQIEELPLLAEKIEKLADEWEWNINLTMNINLVLEEALSNIVFYGFQDNGNHEIKLSISQDDRKLKIRITDKGIPFDPTTHHQPDIALPAEDRPIGGLGIFLIRKIMDEVKYAREKDQNKLTLTKHI